MDGNFRLKIDWASLIPGRKFTIFLCCTLYLMAISKYKPSGGGRGLYSEGRFNAVNGRLFELGLWWGLYLDELLHGGAYFRNFTVLHLSRTVQISSMPIPSSREFFRYFCQDGCTCVCVEELGERRRARGINKRLRAVWKQGKLACAVCLKPRASKRLQLFKPALRFLGLFAVDFLIRKHP